jgi:hypothetical protein
MQWFPAPFNATLVTILSHSRGSPIHWRSSHSIEMQGEVNLGFAQSNNVWAVSLRLPEFLECALLVVLFCCARKLCTKSENEGGLKTRTLVGGLHGPLEPRGCLEWEIKGLKKWRGNGSSWMYKTFEHEIIYSAKDALGLIGIRSRSAYVQVLPESRSRSHSNFLAKDLSRWRASWLPCSVVRPRHGR